MSDYNKIYDPLTKKHVNVHGKVGQQVIQKYILAGGSGSSSPKKSSEKSPKKSSGEKIIELPIKNKINSPSKLYKNSPTKKMINIRSFQCGRFTSQDDCVKQVLNEARTLENMGQEVQNIIMTSSNKYGNLTKGMIFAFGLLNADTTQVSILTKQRKNSENKKELKVKTIHSSFYSFSYKKYIQQLAKEINTLTLNGKEIVCVASDSYSSGVIRRIIWYASIFYR